MDQVELVAVNDLADSSTLAHLLQFDSVQGKLHMEVSLESDTLKVGRHSVKMLSEKDPSKLPWKDLAIDVVLECSGKFRTSEKMQKHIEAGATKVVLSAPARDEVKTIVLGVNDEQLKGTDILVSNASCTTNCLAPMAKVLHKAFGIKKGFMTTTHAYTSDQNLQDAPHRDLRRARAAAQSIIPTTTGAAKAVGLVLPELKGKLDGFALRVPTPSGSIVDLSIEVEKSATAEDVNALMKNAAANELKGILEYTDKPLVSADIVGNTHSCIFDSELTMVKDNLIKVVGWYDNEMGYASRLADLTTRLAKL